MGNETEKSWRVGSAIILDVINNGGTSGGVIINLKEEELWPKIRWENWKDKERPLEKFWR